MMFKKRLACLFLSLPVLAFAGQDPAPFKASILDYCQQERTPLLVKNCIVSAANKMPLLEELSETKAGKKTVALCATSLDFKEKHALYHLLTCVDDQSKLTRGHPYPKWSGEVLKLKKYRSEWVSNCFQEFGGDVGNCVKKQERGFRVFWQDYKSLNGNPSLSLESIKRCTSTPLSKTDFSQYVACRAMRG